eukprot:349978-Chlamydomonas_euryale.AAC.2
MDRSNSDSKARVASSASRALQLEDLQLLFASTAKVMGPGMDLQVVATPSEWHAAAGRLPYPAIRDTHKAMTQSVASSSPHTSRHRPTQV